jgi:DNA adenine methylase
MRSSEKTWRRALRPPLKWAGGKRWLVPHILGLWGKLPERRLAEPFCGGLALALALMPRRALLNDRNPHLIHFYVSLQQGLRIINPEDSRSKRAKRGSLNAQSEEVQPNLPMEEIHKAAGAEHRIVLRMDNDEKLFYDHRRRFNELLATGLGETDEGAALFYYLNRTAFNGLCRFNRSGSFNVPFGQYSRIKYSCDFTPYRAVFHDWEFMSVDFSAVPLEAGDFVYADPPYDVEFTQYAKERFGWPEQVRTAEWLARHKGPVVLSNQATPRILTLYEKLGFKLQLLKGPRRISCTGDRTPANEVFAVKNL